MNVRASSKTTSAGRIATPSRTRRGVASIEFLMMIPVLLAFMLFLLWAFQVRDSALKANIDAQAKAAEQAVQVMQEERLVSSQTMTIAHTESIEQLVRGFQSDLTAGAGLVDGEVDRETSSGFSGVVEGIGPVHGHAELLSHPMKSDVFDFPQDRSAQPPLTVPKAARGIALNYRHFTDFRQVLLHIGND